MANFETKENPGISSQNFMIVVGIFAVVLIIASFFIYNLNKEKNELATNLGGRVNSLVDDSVRFEKKFRELNDKAIALDKEVEDLMLERDRLTIQRDSIAKLLAYSRTNERNSQAKVAQLQQQLKALQTKLNNVQKQYDDLLAGTGISDLEYEQRLRAITEERNNLSTENQKLQQDLIATKGNADNRTAIFATSMKAIPGELKRDKFSASNRSQNTDRIEVSFKLSRAPRPTENLIFKIFDPLSGEIAIKPRYRNELSAPADPTNQKVILEFEQGTLARTMSGNFVVHLYMTDANKGLEDQEIGLAKFILK